MTLEQKKNWAETEMHDAAISMQAVLYHMSANDLKALKLIKGGKRILRLHKRWRNGLKESIALQNVRGPQ